MGIIRGRWCHVGGRGASRRLLHLGKEEGSGGRERWKGEGGGGLRRRINCISFAIEGGGGRAEEGHAGRKLEITGLK